MNSQRILSLVGTGLLAGGLFVGSASWAGAQEHRNGMGEPARGEPGRMADASQHQATDDMMAEMMAHMMGDMMPGMMGDMMSSMMGDMGDGAMAHEAGYSPMGGSMDEQHAERQAAMAQALDLTVDELQAALADGKSLPQIAEEQGVDLVDLHETLMGAFDMHGR